MAADQTKQSELSFWHSQTSPPCAPHVLRQTDSLYPLQHQSPFMGSVPGLCDLMEVSNKCRYKWTFSARAPFESGNLQKNRDMYNHAPQNHPGSARKTAPLFCVQCVSYKSSFRGSINHNTWSLYRHLYSCTDIYTAEQNHQNYNFYHIKFKNCLKRNQINWNRNSYKVTTL